MSNIAKFKKKQEMLQDKHSFSVSTSSIRAGRDTSAHYAGGIQSDLEGKNET